MAIARRLVAVSETHVTGAKMAQPCGRERHIPRWLLNGLFMLSSCVPSCLLPTAPGADPSIDDILTKVANVSIKSQDFTYTGLREYKLRNFRFDKEAAATVQVTYRFDVGTKYTVLERSGSPKLSEIVERLLATEADASKPKKSVEYEISPANYEACLRGTETTAGRICYVIDLVPRHKSKYLIRGTAWVDRNSYGLVRLEGHTSAGVSMWIGAPHIQMEFGEIDGVWLPTHTGAVSSGLLLGTSELEIRYTDYLIRDLGRPVASRKSDAVPQSRP